jgi:hypothetical protein
MSEQYVIAGQEGMTPFATTTNKTEALKLSKRARMLGFTGHIVKYAAPPADADQCPAVMLQIGDRTFRIRKYKPNGYSIHRQRGNGSWQFWMRLHHLNEQADVEAAIQLVRASLPVQGTE